MPLYLDCLSQDTPVDTFKCSGGIGFDRLQSFFFEDSQELQTKHLAATVIATIDDIVVGYITYTLGAFTLEWADIQKMSLESQASEKLPGVMIHYLAVADGHRHQGIGTLLVNYLLSLVYEARQDLPCRILSVEAYDDAIAFYTKFGFEPACAAAQWQTDDPDEETPRCTLMLADLGPR